MNQRGRTLQVSQRGSLTRSQAKMVASSRYNRPLMLFMRSTSVLSTTRPCFGESG